MPWMRQRAARRVANVGWPSIVRLEVPHAQPPRRRLPRPPFKGR
jgi:hypothetical protein